MEGCGQSITAPQTLTCCSIGSSHELAVLQENLPQPGVIHGPQCGYLIHHDPLHVLQGNTCSTMVSSKTPRACRGTSAPVPGTPSPLLLLSPWGLQCCSSLFFSPRSSLPVRCFVALRPFLSIISSAEGLSCALQWVQWSWNWLCQAQGSPSCSSQRPSLQPTTTS